MIYTYKLEDQDAVIKNLFGEFRDVLEKSGYETGQHFHSFDGPRTHKFSKEGVTITVSMTDTSGDVAELEISSDCTKEKFDEMLFELFSNFISETVVLLCKPLTGADRKSNLIKTVVESIKERTKI